MPTDPSAPFRVIPSLAQWSLLSAAPGDLTTLILMLQHMLLCVCINILYAQGNECKESHKNILLTINIKHESESMHP